MMTLGIYAPYMYFLPPKYFCDASLELVFSWSLSISNRIHLHHYGMVGNSSFVLSSRSTGMLIMMKTHDSQDQLNRVE